MEGFGSYDKLALTAVKSRTKLVVLRSVLVVGWAILQGFTASIQLGCIGPICFKFVTN